MIREVELRLNAFDRTPNSLRDDPAVDSPAKTVSVNVLRVVHHEYVDKAGRAPTQGEASHSFLVKSVTPAKGFRFTENGLGTHSEVQRGIVNQYGKAFCRYFLYEHCGLTYFAHIDHVVDASLPKGFNGLRVARCASGDLPDYCCARNVNRIFLGEAKGRTDSISFTTQEFEAWRSQFRRVRVSDRYDRPIRTKGYIVATRFARDKVDSARIRSTLYAEDPETDGDIDVAEADFGSGLFVATRHYVSVFRALRLPVVASALAQGFGLPGRTGIRVGVWNSILPELSGRLFIGGYIPVDGSRFPFPPPGHDFNAASYLAEILDLSRPEVVFFGLEQDVFYRVLDAARSGEILNTLPEQTRMNTALPDVSVQRDGTVMAPLEYFALQTIITI